MTPPINPDDLEPRHKPATKNDLTVLSIGELEDYIGELQDEIARARAAIEAKKAHRSGIDALFKR